MEVGVKVSSATRIDEVDARSRVAAIDLLCRFFR